jgi:hypothetical protein
MFSWKEHTVTIIQPLCILISQWCNNIYGLPLTWTWGINNETIILARWVQDTYYFFVLCIKPIKYLFKDVGFDIVFIFDIFMILLFTVTSYNLFVFAYDCVLVFTILIMSQFIYVNLITKFYWILLLIPVRFRSACL